MPADAPPDGLDGVALGDAVAVDDAVALDDTDAVAIGLDDAVALDDVAVPVLALTVSGVHARAVSNREGARMAEAALDGRVAAVAE